MHINKAQPCGLKLKGVHGLITSVAAISHAMLSKESAQGLSAFIILTPFGNNAAL